MRLTKKKFASMFNACENASELMLKLAIAGIDANAIKKRLENQAFIQTICHKILDGMNMWDLATINTMCINRTLFKEKTLKIKDLKKHGAISDSGIELFISTMRTEMFNGCPADHWIASDRQFCEKVLGVLALAMDADENYSEYKKK